MPGEFYKAAKPIVYLGIARADVDDLFLTAGTDVYAKYLPALDHHTEREPLTAAVRDAIAAGTITENDYPQVLVIEVVAHQIDGGLNEVPQASVRTAVGRDATDPLIEAGTAETVSMGHLLERYFIDGRLKAKLYCSMTTTAAEGAGDLNDNFPWANEWVVLFDGTITGINRRGSATDAGMMLRLTHFTAALGFSSSITGSAASGAFYPAAMPSVLFPTQSAGNLHPAFTMFGAASAMIGGGPVLDTDFWGYQIPGSSADFGQCGLKGFLSLLANQDTFGWANLSAALESSDCQDTYGVNRPRKNDRALAALNRIEPKWPAQPEWTPVQASGDWAGILSTVREVRTARETAGVTAAVTRADIIGGSRLEYYDTGYLYGVPVSFYLSQNTLAPLSANEAFAKDVAGASFADLAARSFWELMVGQYASRYQMAVAPMADRAVVIPFQPLLDRHWQSVASSEIVSWDDDLSLTVPVRGVVLVGNHFSDSGSFQNGNDGSTPGAQDRYQQLMAGYDSCEDGVFEFRAFPGWLVNSWRNPQASAQGTTPARGRATSAVPWITGAVASGVADTLIQSVGRGATTLASYVATGLLRGCPAAPPAWATATASRMAKAMWQQERTKNNTVYVTTRFRYDIGPGSIVRLELPADRYVGPILEGQRDTVMYGMVLRVTLSMDAEGMDAKTHLSVGFARTEGQASAASKLYADTHPFWSTACLGVPWADAMWIRQRLGDGSSIAPTLFNPS